LPSSATLSKEGHQPWPSDPYTHISLRTPLLCTAPHITPAAEIMCNSTVQPGVKASINNTTYGSCRLSVEAKIPCPYKGCFHVSSPSPPHITPAAEIMCNSTVQPGAKASFKNMTYGFCRLSVEAKIPCPYKGCLHISDPPQEADQDSNEAAATQMQAEMAIEIAALDEEIMYEAGEDQARAETMASELEAIGSKTPGNKPPGDDLR
jgi:hypothetical protein